MQKILIAFVLVCLLAIPASAVNFVEIDRDEQTILFLDTDSVSPRGDYVVIWVKWIPRGKFLETIRETLPNNSYSLFFYALNKQHKQYQVLATSHYDEDGSNQKSYSYTFAQHKYEEIIPGSLMDYLYGTVMDLYEQKPSQ